MRSKKSLLTEQTALVWDAPGLIAGVDEAGRGPLAGPVVAAAVIVAAAAAVAAVVVAAAIMAAALVGEGGGHVAGRRGGEQHERAEGDGGKKLAAIDHDILLVAVVRSLMAPCFWMTRAHLRITPVATLTLS